MGAEEAVKREAGRTGERVPERDVGSRDRDRGDAGRADEMQPCVQLVPDRLDLARISPVTAGAISLSSSASTADPPCPTV